MIEEPKGEIRTVRGSKATGSIQHPIIQIIGYLNPDPLKAKLLEIGAFVQVVCLKINPGVQEC